MADPSPTFESDIDPGRLAYSNLIGYSAIQFPGYMVGRHHAIIAAHLEAVERGEIDRLIISMPPRHGKSLLASEFFPAWYLGRNPSHQIICATYAFEKSSDFGRKVRDQLNDPVHQAIFQDCQIDPGRKGANNMGTLQGGNMYSVGVGGAIVGRGAHLFIVDDPIKSREEAESDRAQSRLREWFVSVAYTRMMPGRSGIVVIMTRWHYYDLVGYLLKEKAHENWVELSLPAIADHENDIIGRQSGEALWPEAYPKPRLERIKRTIGTREWTSQYQQSPIPAEGGMVNIEWFQRYNHRERLAFDAATRMGVDPRNTSWGIEKIVCSWDTAFKESDLNDPSACTIWGVGKNAFYLLWVINKRMQFPDLRKAVIEAHQKQVSKYKINPARCPVLIEDKASGQSLIQDLKRHTRIPVIAVKADSNKEVRLSEVTALIEAGRVFLPERATWLVDYETQIVQFPFARHDDMVDSTSQFLRWAGKPRYVVPKNYKYWK